VRVARICPGDIRGWADALCIIQDDEEEEKTASIQDVRGIYYHSLLTISALATESST
jgi:hypothetical protein